MFAIILATTGFFSAAYVVLVRYVRYERQQYISKVISEQSSSSSSSSSASMKKYMVGQEVLRQISLREFPFIYQKSLEFALFRTYAIPSISALLDRNKEFAKRCSRRYDDTSILISEFIFSDLDSPRATLALQRLNYIHGLYKDSISNDDMKYTLSVFVFEVNRWINRFEYRTLTSEEEEATFDFWREVGIRMGIKDIPSTIVEFEKFNVQYEQEKMVFAESNASVANATVDLFVTIAPKSLHFIVKNCVYAFVDERLQKAVGFPKGNATLLSVLEGLFGVRRFVTRHLLLPRFKDCSRISKEPYNPPLPKGHPAPMGTSGAGATCPFGYTSSNTDTTTITPEVAADAVYKTQYNVFDDTYPHGYRIRNLGPPTLANGKIGELYTNHYM